MSKITNNGKGARVVNIQTQGLIVPILPLATVEFTGKAEEDMAVYMAGPLKPLFDSGELVAEAPPEPPAAALKSTSRIVSK